MKTLDVIVACLLVLGGLNWGLIGLFDINIVAAMFGESSAFSRTLFILVGLSAIYQAVLLRGIQKRWGVVAD